jgi:ferrous iron transport protein B
MKGKKPVVALVGQPNCGKSTLFNAVAGFKVGTGNFSGTSVSYAETQVQFGNDSFTLIDLPGTYSIVSIDSAEKVTRDYLLSGNVDVIINVIDASMLSRSLAFTLQLLELKVPMLVVMNMADEAERKGMVIDLAEFKRLTGVEAVSAVAVRGEGIDEIFRKALSLPLEHAQAAQSVQLAAQLSATSLYEKFVGWKPARKRGAREVIDAVIMNPFGGLITVVGSILLMLWVAFSLGDLFAGLIDKPFAVLNSWIARDLSGLYGAVFSGLSQGAQAGLGIVLPYMLPLLLLISIFEDTGLLPRIAFMVDGVLHRFGLHGKALIPLILGYGCTVPAIMSVRNLESASDRFIARLVVPFISCSARTVVVLGLVGKFLGPLWVAAVFAGNLLVTLLASLLLSKFKTDLSFGLIMDVPPLRRPYFGIALKKVWLRLREFFVFGWPILLISSVGLSVLSVFGVDDGVNAFFSPVTEGVLRLPSSVGITLFLGFFRKELALAMLGDTVLSHGQILVFTAFTLLYVPCLASVTTLWKEGGFKTALASVGLSISVALLVSGALAWLCQF